MLASRERPGARWFAFDTLVDEGLVFHGEKSNDVHAVVHELVDALEARAQAPLPSWYLDTDLPGRAAASN